MDLPAPFWPMTPIFAPSMKDRLTSLSTGFWSKLFDSRSRENTYRSLMWAEEVSEFGSR